MPRQNSDSKMKEFDEAGVKHMADARIKPIRLSQRQRAILERIIRRPSSPQGLVRRAKVILAFGEGKTNTAIEPEVGLSRERIGYWRTHWIAESERMERIEEGEEDKKLEEVMVKVLSDEPRSGAPVKFRAEQVVAIVAVACEKPDEASERPISHWTPRELAEEVVKRGIVESISPRQVGRFLKSDGAQAASGRILADSQTGRSASI
jgi:putative transposase